MGASTSVEDVAQSCTYNKNSFNRRLEAIRDAHGLVQYYATLLLQEKLPVQLPEYRTYGEIAEGYFNTRRKDQIPELLNVNPKINNYYDFYNALLNLQREYEKSDITGTERRAKIVEVFNTAHVVLQLLIEELWESCDVQGRPPVEASTEGTE